MLKRLATAHPLLRWCALLSLSVLLAALFLAVQMPAAVLLACMLSGMALAMRDVRLEVGPPAFALAQGVLGCLIARSLQSR